MASHWIGKAGQRLFVDKDTWRPYLNIGDYLIQLSVLRQGPHVHSGHFSNGGCTVAAAELKRIHSSSGAFLHEASPVLGRY
eukprot:scaffold1804_cov359-Prasinococcus_capsulatus_cf.AAC.4